MAKNMERRIGKLENLRKISRNTWGFAIFQYARDLGLGDDGYRQMVKGFERFLPKIRRTGMTFEQLNALQEILERADLLVRAHFGEEVAEQRQDDTPFELLMEFYRGYHAEMAIRVDGEQK